MHSNRTGGAEPPRQRANPAPPVGNVCGLGESHALRVELRPVQLPWLADEIDELRGPIEEELARARARHNQLTAEGADPRSPEALEASAEIDRRIYQLKVLEMIREQLPISRDTVAAGVASPWKAKGASPDEGLDTVGHSIAVVGPAQGMLVLIDGAARNVASALATATVTPKAPTLARQSRVVRLRSVPTRITPPVAARLRALAAAAEAFIDTYINVVLQQSYRFDPDYDPVLSDELW
jgi:hypothetical protein